MYFIYTILRIKRLIKHQFVDQHSHRPLNSIVNLAYLTYLCSLFLLQCELNVCSTLTKAVFLSGPHLFLSCPIDPTLSQSWFNNLWNYSLAPYLMEAIREGLQLYGVKSGTHWEDPTSWVEETYPWSPSSVRNKQQSSVSSSPSRNSSCSTTNYNPSLIRIRKEDVGFDKVCRSLGIESSGTSYDNNFSISQ